LILFPNFVSGKKIRITLKTFIENKMANNTVKLHRVFAAPVEKVYKAFTDADALASWIPPYGFVCRVHRYGF
jgi:uncharacterized protein YndB with AHSA1/START domain